MKLAFYNDFQLGVVRGDQIVNVMAAVKEIKHMTPQQLISGVIAEFPTLRPALEKAAQGRGEPLSRVKLRPPLPKPTTIICAAVNYREFGAKPPPYPMDAFLKSSKAVIGPGDTVVLPDCKATIFHHEAELGVVIGREAKNVSQAQAMDYVFGYTNFMDISARGFAPLGPGRTSFFLGKSWDTFAPLGPFIATADEVPDPHSLQVKLWDNGEPRHDYNTSDMAHNIPELIELYSSVISLEPGDVIATGTNHQGIGAIQDGDRVEMEIPGLGRLSVNVRDDLKRSWPRGIDQQMAARARGAL